MLIVTDAEKPNPVLMPILRRDVVTQGPRSVINVGDKIVDYSENFRLYLVTRSSGGDQYLTDVNTVSFTTTRQGLAGQVSGRGNNIDLRH